MITYARFHCGPITRGHGSVLDTHIRRGCYISMLARQGSLGAYGGWDGNLLGHEPVVVYEHPEKLVTFQKSPPLTNTMAEAEGTQQPFSWARPYWRSFRRHPRGYKAGGWCCSCCLSLELSLSEARLRDIKAIISPVEAFAATLSYAAWRSNRN